MGLFNGTKKIEPVKKPTAVEARKPAGAKPSISPCPPGRRFALFFVGVFDGDAPLELDRLEFQADAESPMRFLQRGYIDDPDRAFRADKVSRALGMLILDYLCATAKQKGYQMVGESGSPAASLGYAIDDAHRQWNRLFIKKGPGSESRELAKVLFLGTNFNGKNSGARVIYPNREMLPPSCIEINFNAQPLSGLPKIQKLADEFRKAHGLPPSSEFDIPAGEGSTPKEPIVKPAEAENPPEAKTKTAGGKADVPTKTETPSQPRLIFPQPKEITPPPIDPRFFQVRQSGESWPDETPLLAWGDENAPSAWTLRNAFEGILIMGATGSGKTSGSGVAFAESFLRAGFGGLILTVKRDESEHWQSLCKFCGREDDLIVVERRGKWKLNILGYEAQRPGLGNGLSENLVALCHNLLAMSAREQRGQRSNEQFWHNATNQLLNATFDMFLLAGESITFDRLADFVAAAPTGHIPETEEDWLKIPAFGEVLTKAAKAVDASKVNEDIRILRRTTDYWCKIYPGLAANTRTSITLGVFAMLDAFRGRDIPDLISSETNITPEEIMSGKIVVLNLPIKEFGQAGLLVQSAWKYLFQLALERQSAAGDPLRRPVFLWEDEAQYFFSEHDHHFQDTARSARVSRVILTQNLPNFYKAFGQDGRTVADSVFGNLNTKVFHANSDPTTNEWAAKIFGQEMRPRVTINHGQQQAAQSKDVTDTLGGIFNPPTSAGISTTGQWELSVRPEEFNSLRNGGRDNGYQVDAFITWVGYLSDGLRHFTHITFNQNPDLA